MRLKKPAKVAEAKAVAAEARAAATAEEARAAAETREKIRTAAEARAAVESARQNNDNYVFDYESDFELPPYEEQPETEPATLPPSIFVVGGLDALGQMALDDNGPCISRRSSISQYLNDADAAINESAKDDIAYSYGTPLPIPEDPEEPIYVSDILESPANFNSEEVLN
ncbi:hypothetical protein BC937DRAFT_92761, partial [Endogone sp. FLAS-F59071]